MNAVKAIYLVVVVCIATMLFTGCVVPTQLAPSMEFGDTRTMAIKDNGVLQRPLVADLVIGQQKVNGTAFGYYPERDFKQIEREAIYDACDKADCDILFNPRFNYKIEEEVVTRNTATGNSFKVKMTKITVNVNGFPANYGRFRDIQESDYKWIEIFHKKN